MRNTPVPQTMHAMSEGDTGAGTFRLIFQRVLYLTLSQVRMIAFWGHVALVVVTIGAVLLLTREGQPASYQYFYDIFEVLFPLAAGFLFVPLVLVEQHQRTLALIGVTQCSLPFLFALRLLLTVLFFTILITVLVFMLRLSPSLPDSLGIFQDPQIERDLRVWPADLLGGPDGIPAVLLTLGAPIFLLAGIGTAIAHLAADTRVGYLAIFAVWLFNRAAGLTLDTHPLFRYVYLFTRSGGTGDWLMAKLAQLVLGTGLLFLSWLLLHKLEPLLREP